MTGFSVVSMEDVSEHQMTFSVLHVGKATVRCSTDGRRVAGPEVCLAISSGPWILDDAYNIATRDTAHITITPDAARAFAAHLCELADKAEAP